MGWEDCGKSTSISSNRYSYTAYYYMERNIHPLCIPGWEITTSSALIKTSVPGWDFVESVMGRVHSGSYPELAWLLFKAQVAYTGRNVCGCQQPLSARGLAPLVSGQLFARQKAGQKKQQQHQLPGVAGQARVGREGGQIIRWARIILALTVIPTKLLFYLCFACQKGFCVPIDTFGFLLGQLPLLQEL